MSQRRCGVRGLALLVLLACGATRPAMVPPKPVRAGSSLPSGLPASAEARAPQVATLVELAVQAKTGCRYVGRLDGPIALSIDPATADGTVGMLESAVGEVTFGGKGDSTAHVRASFRGYELTAMARTVDVAMFPQRKLLYLGVFEPRLDVPLQVIPSEVTENQWTVSSPAWKGEATVIFVGDAIAPMRASCADLKPERNSEIAEQRRPYLGTNFAGGVPLAATPGGKAVVTTPAKTAFNIISVHGGYAFGEWSAPEGWYRGFVKASLVEAESGSSFNSGRNVQKVALAAPSPCTRELPLYLIRATQKAYLIGRVPPGVEPVYAEPEEVAVVKRAGRTENVVRIETQGSLQLSAGNTLAAPRRDPKTCQLLP
jgi:hypothetical protein